MAKDEQYTKNKLPKAIMKYLFLIIILVLFSGCHIGKHWKSNLTEDEYLLKGLNFLKRTHLFTKEKLNALQSFNKDTLSLIGSLNGLTPDSDQSELENSFHFDDPKFTFSDYRIQSIEISPKKFLKKEITTYSMESDYFVGFFELDTTSNSLTLINIHNQDSSLMIKSIKYQVELIRWNGMFDYEIDLIKIK